MGIFTVLYKFGWSRIVWKIRSDNGWESATSSQQSKGCSNSVKVDIGFMLPKVVLKSKTVLTSHDFWNNFSILLIFTKAQCYHKTFDIFLKSSVIVFIVSLVVTRFRFLDQVLVVQLHLSQLTAISLKKINQ